MMVNENEQFVDETMSKVEKSFSMEPRNRAERRAAAKANRSKNKKKKKFIDDFQGALQEVAYMKMIEKVRALNEKIIEEGEKEKNEATTENN